MTLTKKEIYEKIARQELTVEQGLHLIRQLPRKPLEGNYVKEFKHNDKLLKDHLILGKQVLMGVVHCSLAIEAARLKFPERAVTQLKKITFFDPIKVEPDENVAVTVEIEETTRHVTFKNTYKTSDAQQLSLTASGEVGFSNLQTDFHRELPLENLVKRASWVLSGDRYYENQELYGPTFFTLRKTYFLEDGVLAYCRLTPEALAEKTYVIHPAYFDACGVNTLFAVTSGKFDDSPGVPIFIKTISLFDEIPESFYCYTRVVKKTSELVVSDTQYYTEQGILVMSVEGLSLKRIPSNSAFGIERTSPEYPEKIDATEQLQHQIETYIKAKITQTINDPKKTLAFEKNFMDLGINSLDLINLSKTMEKEVGIELYPTLFFEYQNVKELTCYFVENHAESFSKYLHVGKSQSPEKKESSTPVSESSAPHRIAFEYPVQQSEVNKRDVAVIGMAGRFAEADNLDQFWENLAASKDLIKEIPPDRWDYRPWFDENREAENKTYSKWGSFLNRVDTFDPLFFGIAPKEAVWMDPQARLLMEVLYETIEDAGYCQKITGSATGVYVGVCYHDYWDEIARAHIPIKDYQYISSSLSALSGRISYIFDLQGENIPIDNACASSLTAAHVACKALRNKEIDMAFVAGTNLLLSPYRHVSFSRAQALSPTGRCHTFDNAADGYVPGEGILAVLLKPLDKALEDHDNIHAIIKGTAANHVGKANNASSPRPELQTKVILNAWQDSGVEPETITFIEAHGTGTQLGDPIEITALRKAFSSVTDKKNFCAVGSVKAFIGHLEGGAGLAGMMKVILSMKHHKIPRMPHFKELNPYIQLKDSALYVNEHLEEWTTEPGVPRRAGVSSFGVTGNNAHVVLEEFIPQPRSTEISLETSQPEIFLFSGKTQEALQDSAERFKTFFEESPKPTADIRDIVYTLQTGRRHYEYRLAVLSSTIQELVRKLKDYLNSSPEPGVYTGKVTTLVEETTKLQTIHETGRQLYHQKNMTEIAHLWVQGAEIDWEHFYQQGDRTKVSLPTYPFAQQRYWMPEVESPLGPAAKLHPLIHTNISTLREQKFQSCFTGDEFYFAEHLVNSKKVLPGVVYIEMVRAAGELAGEKKVWKIRNIIWQTAITADGHPDEIQVSLYPDKDSVRYEVRSKGKPQEKSIHSYGKIVYGTEQIRPEYLDIAAIKRRCSESIAGKECYDLIRQGGLHLGASFRVIQEILRNDREALASVQLPSVRKKNFTEFVLHPSLMDAAFQTMVGLVGNKNDRLYLPFTLAEVEILQPLSERCYAYMQVIDSGASGSRSKKFDVSLVNESGNVLVKMKELVARPFAHVKDLQQAVQQEAREVLYFHPVWKPSKIDNPEHRALQGNLLIFDTNPDLYNMCLETFKEAAVTLITPAKEFQQRDANIYAIYQNNPEDYRQLFRRLKTQALLPDKIIYSNSFVEECSPDSPEEHVPHTIYPLFSLSKALMEQKPESPIQLLYLIHKDSPDDSFQYAVNTAIAGFAKTIRKENPKFLYKTVDIRNWARPDLEIVFNEFHKEDAAVEIRYEQGQRQVKHLEELVTPPETKKFPLRDNGVFLITGGFGGLGLIFAEYLAKQVNARLVLTSRSDLTPEKKEKLRNLEALGAEALYVKADVSKKAEVENLIKQAKSRFQEIHGIIHSAGLVRDSLIVRKTEEEIRSVLAPKVAGSIYLDEATQAEHLDFFVLFSSVSAVTGNAGQCDYAYANSFLDQFAVIREKLRTEKKRFGKTLSINWYLWENGGMRVDPQTRRLVEKTTGTKPLQTETGLQAFALGLTLEESQLIVIEGEREKVNQSLGVQRPLSGEAVAQSLSREESGSWAITVAVREKFQKDLLKLASDALMLDENSIDVHADMDKYGFDSLTSTEFANKINEQYGFNITPALFFEYLSVASLCEHLIKEHNEVLIQYYQQNRGQVPGVKKEQRPEQENVAAQENMVQTRFQPVGIEQSPALSKLQQGRMFLHEPIAIIGMSGKMPQSDDLEVFWKNLEQGKDLITEIPEDRWDWREYYGDPATENNKTYVKWAGFMNAVDTFDARFFGISPREAELMDPQQRLFLETVWKTIEDAGYKPSDLAGTKTGIFVGVSTSDYAELLGDSSMKIEAHTSTGGAHSILANRVSYLLDLHGPSEPINTACSSSLISIHRAVEAIRNADCDMAIAGGVGVILSPATFISFSRAGMLSKDGRCKTFDKSANGYARGEGVGAILLKPLSKAQADGDHIYAIIRGTAVNHGGKAKSLTAPNPSAQAELIIDAYTKARICPSTVTYIEAHGTGTSLGDPVEIEGLKKAFAELYTMHNTPLPEKAHCGIGSVKTNIGHLEAAAGIAGVIKVLLSMRYKKIPATVHFKELNPYIQLENTPFYIVQDTKPWERLLDKDNQPLPRRAGISSFGFGGANAYIVLEEYAQASLSGEQFSIRHEPQIVVLSAKNEERLRDYAQSMIVFLSQSSKAVSQVSLKELAYTLQVGRETMEERLAVVVSNVEELREKFVEYVHGKKDMENVYRGKVKRTPTVPSIAKLLIRGTAGKQFISAIIEDKALSQLAQLWVLGVDIDWKLLYAQFPRRISLPTYPFAKERHWVITASGKSSETKPRFHPLLGSIDAELSVNDGLVFQKTLRSTDVIVQDHKVLGQPVFPGVGYLELANAACSHISGQNGKLTHVVWLTPLYVNTQKTIWIAIKKENNQYYYSVQSKNGPESIIHSKGVIEPQPECSNVHPQRIAIEEIQARCSIRIDKDTLYARFRELGITYGVYFQGLREVWGNSEEALGVLHLPWKYEDELNSYILHPCLIDSTLQTIGGIRAGSDNIYKKLMLPFSVEKIEIYRPIPAKGYSYVKATGNDSFHAALVDEMGRVCVKLSNIAIKELEVKDQFKQFFYLPQWRPCPLSAATEEKKVDKHTILMIYPEHAKELQTRLAIAHGNDEILEIRFGSENRRLSGKKWEIRAETPEALGNCIKDLEKLDTIYFMGGVTGIRNTEISLEILEQSEQQGVLSLYRLLRALVHYDLIRHPIQLKVITNDAHQIFQDQPLIPYSAGLFGLCRSAAHEFSQLKISCIDVSFQDFKGQASGSPQIEEARIDKLIQAIVLESFDRQGDQVALRKGKRYVRTMNPVMLPEVNTSLFKPRRVYLILGGAGGIGLELCRYLAETVQARLVLLGRNALSDLQQKKIAEIESRGGEVLYLQADATNLRSLQKAVSRAKSRFREINGVIHSALVLQDKTLRNMEETTFRAVQNPKAKGSVALFKAVEHEPLDFMLFFSSVQSFAGNIGQSNYAAGCTFKDAFALFLNQKQSYPVKTINWGYWGSVGVVATDEYKRQLSEQGIHSILPEQGMEAINRILSHNVTQVIAFKAEKPVLKKLGINFHHCLEVYPETIPSLIAQSEEFIKPEPLPLTELHGLKKAFNELEDFGGKVLVDVFRKMGVFHTENEQYSKIRLREQLHITPNFSRLYEALLDILSNQGFLRISDKNIVTTSKLANSEYTQNVHSLTEKKEELTGKFPGLRSHLNFLWECLQHYPAILKGNLPATDIIFPNSSMELVERMYKGNPISDYFNSLVAQSVQAYIRTRFDKRSIRQSHRSQDEKIKILEVGAGTGSTSASVLEGLSGYCEHLEYLYTDISAGFIQYGKACYGKRYPFVEFGLLDIEKDVKNQGYKPSDFDIVIGANVLHTTRNLRNTLQHIKTLLKTHGWLIVNEVTQVQTFLTLTFGLLEGWWVFEDEEYRLKHSPLFSPEMWETLLKEEGFERVVCLGKGDKEHIWVNQHVLIAESNGHVELEGQKTYLQKEKRVIHQAKTSDSVEVKTRKAEISEHQGKVPQSKPVTQEEVKLDLEQKIIEILAKTLQIDKQNFSDDLPFADIGVDSILAVEIIERINTKFCIQLRTTDLFNYSTLQSLTDYIMDEFGYLPDASEGTSITTSELFHAQTKLSQEERDKGGEKAPLPPDDTLTLLRKLENGELDVDEVEQLTEEMYA